MRPISMTYAERSGVSCSCPALSVWADRADDAKHVQCTRDFGDAIKPFALGGGYMNYMTGDEGAERIRAAYGAQYERLVEIKRTYDPSNFFRGNQNIHP